VGRSASWAGDSEGLYNVTVRVRGSVKNRLLGEAERLGCSLSELVLLAVEDFCRGRDSVPGLSDGVRPPDVGDVLRAYVSGERVLEPCGRVAPCGRVERVVGSFRFCDVCGVRVG
jgi:hypothetical protein